MFATDLAVAALIFFMGLLAFMALLKPTKPSSRHV